MFDIETLDADGVTREIGALAGLLHACVHDGASIGFVLPFGMADARAFWRDRIAPGVVGGLRHVLVARDEGHIVGTVQLGLDTMPNQTHRADISKLLVDPHARRRGIGRVLMMSVEKLARCEGRSLLTLDTRTGDGAEPLYLSLGYEIAGVIPDYALAPERDRLDSTTVMFKRLGP